MIKTFEEDIATSLADAGYRYIIESINNKTVYCFFYTEKLKNFIEGEPILDSFFFDKKLRF